MTMVVASFAAPLRFDFLHWHAFLPVMKYWRRASLRRILGSFFLAGSALLLVESVLPDICDGHSGVTPYSVIQASHPSMPTPGHSPDAPHVCHAFHGHGIALAVSAIAVSQSLIVVQPGSLFRPILHAASHAKPFRPPIG
ncbi:MAG: hypothetical protein ACREMC_10915 [Gemmatimonadales bacterium]